MTETMKSTKNSEAKHNFNPRSQSPMLSQQSNSKNVQKAFAEKPPKAIKVTREDKVPEFKSRTTRDPLLESEHSR